MAVHKSRRTARLEMRPDLVLVSCGSLGVEGVFDPKLVTVPLCNSIRHGELGGRYEVFGDGAAIGSGAVVVMLSCADLLGECG